MIDQTNAELEQQIRDISRGRGSRFLAPAARGGNGHGYLTRPMRALPEVADPPEIAARIGEATSVCDEPEAPSRAWVNAEVELAVERNALRHAAKVMQLREIRQGLTVDARIADAQRRAKLQHLNIRNDVFVIERMLQRAERAGTTIPAAALERLETVEALLDGVAHLQLAA